MLVVIEFQIFCQFDNLNHPLHFSMSFYESFFLKIERQKTNWGTKNCLQNSITLLNYKLKMLSVKFPHYLIDLRKWYGWKHRCWNYITSAFCNRSLKKTEFSIKLMCLCCLPVGGEDKFYIASGQKADYISSSPK